MPDPADPAVIEEATDHKTTQSRAVEPVTVAVIGTGDGSKLPTGTVATTPGAHEPNVIIQVVTPIAAILIRFANTFGVALLGLLTAAVTPAGSRLLYTKDFYHLLITCSSLSLPVAGLGLIKDLITVLTGLEKKFPLASGSV